jgi:PAS domain S-box-containing protein
MTQAPTVSTFADYLTVGEAADFLGVSPWTLRNWDNSGKLKPSRHPVSDYRMYLRSDLEALLQTDGVADKRRRTSTPSLDWSEIGDTEHFVQFYENDKYLVDSVSAYVGRALVAGEGAVIIATKDHRKRIQRILKRRGIEVTEARDSGQYLALDAEQTLAKFMAAGSPDPARFEESVGALVAQLEQAWPRVRAFGEMVALLWADGNSKGACKLEALWNDLAKRRSFTLFCAYPLNGFRDEPTGASLNDVCSCHTRVIPAESYSAQSTQEEQLRSIAILQQKAQRLQAEIDQRKAAECELSDFIENALEGLHKVGPDGTILWANKAELQMLGYEEHEYIGRHISEFHADREAINDILARLLTGENIYNQPAVLRCKNGDLKHVLIHSNAYFERGQFLYSRCFTRDMTEIRQADRDRAMLAAIIESSQDAIISKTFDGVIRSWNAGAERLFGYSPEEAVGQPITLIIPPERHGEEREILARLRRGERIEHFETIRVAKDRRQIDISLTISPLRDSNGYLIGASKIARDISERKQAELQLKEADRRKDEFLATLAHELRNPLAPIRNGLHILRMSGHSGAGAGHVHEMMERQVAHMVRLVDDLLELSRISRGQIELKRERIGLATVIKHAIETTKPFIESGEHRLDVSLPDDPVMVDGDIDRLTQIFANLLNNAAKYTNKGGAISVEVSCSGNDAVVAVRDNGIGIQRDMLSRVFEMFAQVKNPLRRSQDGLGIGLNLVRTLVEMHQGSVEARSEGLGKGSEFVVRLPLSRSQLLIAQCGPGAGEEQTETQPVRRILCVDDNRDSADSLGMMLRYLGADVQVAYDGPSALEAIKICRPSIILMDLGMPEVDGCEVARRIRQDPQHQEVLLIAMTGWGQEEDRRRSREAGFDHHLVKPVDLSALQALLASSTG